MAPPCAARHARRRFPSRDDSARRVQPPLTLDAETIEPAVRRYRPPSSSSASPEDGRFPPGQLLVDRYRVISLVVSRLGREESDTR